MKRRIAIVLLLLAGGAIVNVAVAWGSQLALARLTPDWREMDAAESAMAVDRIWPSHFQTDAGAVEVNWLVALGTDAIIVSELANGTPYHLREHAYELRAGWPARSLQYLSAHGSPDYKGSYRFALPTGVGHLPLMPLVAGFIINTLFYALPLWLLFFTPFAARRMLRRRRGQCAECAYPIGVSPVCTECGAAVRRPEPPETRR